MRPSFALISSANETLARVLLATLWARYGDLAFRARSFRETSIAAH